MSSLITAKVAQGLSLLLLIWSSQYWWTVSRKKCSSSFYWTYWLILTLESFEPWNCFGTGKLHSAVLVQYFPFYKCKWWQNLQNRRQVGHLKYLFINTVNCLYANINLNLKNSTQNNFAKERGRSFF